MGSSVSAPGMEYRAIMPYVVGTWFHVDLGDIGDKPMHVLRSRTQSAPGEVDCGLRDVEDGDVLVSAKKQIINRGGFAAPPANDGGRAVARTFSLDKTSNELRTRKSELSSPWGRPL